MARKRLAGYTGQIGVDEVYNMTHSRGSRGSGLYKHKLFSGLGLEMRGHCATAAVHIRRRHVGVPRLGAGCTPDWRRSMQSQRRRGLQVRARLPAAVRWASARCVQAKFGAATVAAAAAGARASDGGGARRGQRAQDVVREGRRPAEVHVRGLRWQLAAAAEKGGRGMTKRMMA